MNSTGDEFEADNTARLLHKPYHHSQPFNKGDSQQGMNEVLSLLRTFGLAYRHVSMYRCKDALVVLQQLSPTQARTGWALTLAGRAHFELVDYRSASSCFEEARRKYVVANMRVDVMACFIFIPLFIFILVSRIA